MNPKKRGVSAGIFFNSKSQAAIFLVMATAIILSGVLYFFYQGQAAEKEAEILQPEAVPVKLYVENCIKSAAEDGLEKIGLSGGYISIPEKTELNQRAYLAAFPASGLKIPYWRYNGINTVPTEDFINLQLASHIKSELKGCIKKFEPFADRFEINELQDADVKVEFNENDVTVKLKYPLEVISKDGSLKELVQNFGYVLPVRFKKVYELAKLIMERENRDFFIEKKTIDLYSMDVEIPTTDVEATCKTKVWGLGSIKQKLQTLLRVNLPYIRIKGTDYNPSLYVPNPSGKSIYSETYFQQHYVWEVDKDSEKKYKNMKVAFIYDNWPLEIYARPSQNGILRSNSQRGTDMLSFFCLHIWHFTYDIGYPVMVSVVDMESDNNQRYQFNFVFKASIDHNQPSAANSGTVLFEPEDAAASDEYCNAVQNEIIIFTADNSTGEGIRDVNLTFVCGRFYCGIGTSNWLSFGSSAGITKRLPYCVNGILKGAKAGYSEAKSFIQTDADGRSYVLALNPVKEFTNYRVVKHLLSNPGIANELAPNEKASIMIKGRSSGFESFAVYPKEEGIPLKIPDGKEASYDVVIYITDDENLIGGYIGEWSLGRDSLKGANEIVFHVLEQGPASDDERFLFISGLSSYSKKIPLPELK